MSDEPGSAWQAIADAADRLLSPHPPFPALATTRVLPVATPRDAEVKSWADKAYQGADGIIRLPFRGLRLNLRQRRHNSTHARIRCLDEQMAALKGWRLPRKLRCSTNRVTATVKTIPDLRHAPT
ncbi:hypothetical protein A6A06_19220 [Streptomyces sp. CB02923]|uniref:hypothetical protein n=1 Tax=Streptomyces sp. CB02923 TaxID=1718985 RepID=UPI000968BE9F|nr:hypothetical protein [Streptomyces sp. CB02923]OKI01002.1 hypothetical protein A6A06_19220 [Streptomyces sp. CB02923]